MYKEDMQPVLRCGQCNKPFEKESTLKRHGYYCRSRRAGGTTRSRACLSCAKGKARCDNKRPQCSRCLTNGGRCQYPAKSPEESEPRTQHRDGAQLTLPQSTPPLVADSPSVESELASSDGDIVLDSTFVTSDPEFADLDETYLGWNDIDLDFTGFLESQTLDPQMNSETVQNPSSGSASLVRHVTPSTNQGILAQQASYSPNISIPPMLSSRTLRLLIRRPEMKAGAERIANLMLYTLKSYPLMMLRHNTLPPFVHHHFTSPDGDSNHTELLTNCISLVHMISSGIKGSRKLFWKNVQLECERLCQDSLKLNELELLSGMLALFIYILIRLDEGETENNDIDFLLIAAVAAIAQQHVRNDIARGMDPVLHSNHDLKASWKHWVYEESRRRLSVLYRVVNMLIYFEPAAQCGLQKDLIFAPLPARKQLWEAKDEFAWNAERERELGGGQTDFGLAANGELVRLNEGQLYGSGAALLYKPLDTMGQSESAKNWEEWSAGMDGLGGLVMLVASLAVS